jgi:predicted exporter
MTVAFMSLIAAQVVDRIHVRAGLLSLVPMLLLGAASVLYWRVTELAGAGNVIPYGVLQGYAVLMLLLITVLHPSRYTRGGDIYWVFAAYLGAKLFETFDRELFVADGMVSGHSLKHVAAAVAGLFVARMLWRRALLHRHSIQGAAPAW